jgi:hypothetical protein
MDHRLQIPFEHAVHIADRQLGAVVLDHAVGRQHVAADLAAEVDVELGILGLARLFLLLLQLVLVEACAELLERAVAVLVLRALVLALDHDSRRNVRNPDSGIGRIHMLSAFSGGSTRIDAQILLFDNDFDLVINFRIDGDGSK